MIPLVAALMRAEQYLPELSEYRRAVEFCINKLMTIGEMEVDILLLDLRSGIGRQTTATRNCANDLGEKCHRLRIPRLYSFIIARSIEPVEEAQAVPPKPIQTKPVQLNPTQRSNIEARLGVARNELKIISEKSRKEHSLVPNEVRRGAIADIGILVADSNLASSR